MTRSANDDRYLALLVDRATQGLEPEEERWLAQEAAMADAPDPEELELVAARLNVLWIEREGEDRLPPSLAERLRVQARRRDGAPPADAG